MAQLNDLLVIGETTFLGPLSLNEKLIDSRGATGTSNSVLKSDANGNVFWSKDNNTWRPNTSTQDGYVASSSGQSGKVWKTDNDGVPGWRDEKDTWRANGTSSSGYVASPAGAKYKVWSTSNSGLPQWHDPLVQRADYTSGLKIATGVTDASISNLYVPTATTNRYGVVKIGAANSTTVTVQSVTKTSGRNYQVEANSDGKLFVNVPWIGTQYSPVHSTGIALTTGAIQNIYVPTSTSGSYGVSKVYANRTTQISAAVNSTANRYYGVESDSLGRLFVNVPWSDSNTLRLVKVDGKDFLTTNDLEPLSLKGGNNITLTTGALGAVEIGHSNASITASTTTAYIKKIKYNEYGHLTEASTITSADLTGLIPAATTNSYGGIKTGYTSDGLNRAVLLSSGKAYVTQIMRQIKVNGNSTLATNSSVALNLKNGSNITITSSATTAGEVTISATNTTYTAQSGLTMTGTAIGHSNTAITASTTTAYIKKIKYNSYGHITEATSVTSDDLKNLIPTATSTVCGGILTNYSASGNRRAVTLNTYGRAYVEQLQRGVSILNGTTTRSILGNDSTDTLTLVQGDNVTLAVTTTTGQIRISVPTASSSTKGAVTLYSGQDCTTYTSEDGAVTPAAAKKAVTTFVSFSRNLTSGTKIGTLTIGDDTTDLYCSTNSYRYRPIAVNGTQILSNTTSTTLYLKAGNNVTLSTSSTTGEVIISASGGSSTDENLKQNHSTTTYAHPLLMTATSGATSTSARTTTAIFNNQIYALPGDGTLIAVSYNATSDERLKENFVSIEAKGSILDLPIYKFDFKQGPKNQIGCKAQDLQKICPELVKEDADTGYLSIQESKLIYLLIEEVKKLKEEVKRLGGY